MNEKTHSEETHTDIQVLLGEIRKKAEAESREIIAEAEKTAEQKLTAAEAQGERIKGETKERAEARAESTRETKLANLAMQKKRIRLHQNEEIMQLVMQRVENSIEDKVDTFEYARALEGWAVEACLGIGTEAALLETSRAERKYFDPAKLDGIGKKVRERGGPRMEITLSGNDNSDPGVLARSPDGRLVYDNRIVTRIRRNKNRLRKIIHQELIQKGTI